MPLLTDAAGAVVAAEVDAVPLAAPPLPALLLAASASFSASISFTTSSTCSNPRTYH